MTTGISLQVTYKGGRPLAAYLYLRTNGKRQVDRSEELEPGLVVDFDADARAIGLEILSPEAVTLDQVWALFDRLGIERPAAAELSPLTAA
jgi:uncharacterized protein YuzE